MRMFLLTVLLLGLTAPALAQEELTTSSPVYTTAPTTKFVVGSILLDSKNERVVGQLVNETKAIGDPGKAGTLTVRTSNQVGTITLAVADPSIVTGAEINVSWNGGVNFRRDMIVGTVAGVVIPISGGKGDALPALNAAVTAPATMTRTFGVELPPIEWTGAKARKFLRTVNKGGTLPGGSINTYWLQEIMKDDPKLAGTIAGTPD